MRVNVVWKGDMVFQAVPPSGEKFTMDAHPDHHGKGLGPTPLETLVGALGACSAMDIVSILEKKRMEIEEYRVEVHGERAPQGEFPRPFTKFTVKHIIKGKDLNDAAVAQAVGLSDEKYCSVIATLREKPEVESVYELLPSAE